MDDVTVVQYPVAMATSDVMMAERRRALPRALMGGTDAMRAATTNFTPQHPAESKDSYATRLGTTTLFGVFAETVHRLSAKFFTKPVILDDNVPKQIEDLAEDIDGENTALTPFMMKVVDRGFVDGISYVFIDFPAVIAGSTLADQQAMKARPYWVHICADNVLGWKTDLVNGQRVLSQFRYKELVDVSDPTSYDENIKERIRVLNRGGFEVWEKQISNGVVTWNMIQAGTTTWQDILVVPVYINRVNYFQGLPPLRSLAELCQEHWNSSSEQRHALTLLRFAMLAISGVPDQKAVDSIIIGPDRVIGLPPGGEAKYVEHNGAGLASGDKDIQNIEARMKSCGMELRIENGGSVTATAAAIDSQETNAGLKAVAKGIEDAIETMLQYTAITLGLPDGGDAEVFDEFAEAVETTDVPQLINMYNVGLLSRDTLWKEMKRRHVLDDDFDPDKEDALIAAEAPRIAPGSSPLGIGTPGAGGAAGSLAANKETPPKADGIMAP